MANLNKVFLIGRLTRDVELRWTPNGTAVANLGIAINRVWNRDGERKEEAVFVDVTAWGRLAEVCGEYLAKGRECFIEGRLHLDQWQAEDGSRRQKLKVIAERIQFISGSKNGNDVPEDF